MNETQKPIARREDLVIQEMPGEVLVYDLQTNKAHCLNETAAAIWKSCDGTNTVADISRLTNGAGEDLVWLAIDQLSEKNLLAAQVPTKFTGQTRREVIKKVGLAAVVALPIVTSLIAPTVASAGSACAGGACSPPAQCNLGMTCNTAGGCSCSTSNSAAAGGCANANCTTCNGTCTVQQNAQTCTNAAGSGTCT